MWRQKNKCWENSWSFCQVLRPDLDVVVVVVVCLHPTPDQNYNFNFNQYFMEKLKKKSIEAKPVLGMLLLQTQLNRPDATVLDSDT